MKRNLRLKESSRKLLSLIVLLTVTLLLHAQEKTFIEGVVADTAAGYPIPYANVVLYSVNDSTLIKGVNTNVKGCFKIDVNEPGFYRLNISYVGYDQKSRLFNIEKPGIINTDTVFLAQETTGIGEVIVAYERIKAKKVNGKSVYFVNKKLRESSDTGMDLIKHLPGVQVDMMQNVSLEGSNNILFLVNGRERDKEFLSQIDSRQVNKVELLTSPGPEYAGDSRGVINIILKEEKDRGLSGHVFAESPTSKSNIYVSPSASVNFKHKKLSIYSSYNGGINYFNIRESIYRKKFTDEGHDEIFSDQYVRQKSWSHRFQLGLDLLAGENDKLGFYYYYKPFSTEFDGEYDVNVSQADGDFREWSTAKEETDLNHISFYSLYYKHHFPGPGHKIILDASLLDYTGINETVYTGTGQSGLPLEQINRIEPLQYSFNFKADYSNSLSGNTSFSAGLKTGYSILSDRLTDRFHYTESIVSTYSSISMNLPGIDINAGLRLEYSLTGSESSVREGNFVLLPSAEINYQPKENGSLSVSYRRSLRRPGITRLNPHISVDGPMSMSGGNPELDIETISHFNLDYSRTIGKSYITAGLFFTGAKNVINRITYLNVDDYFETLPYNLGRIYSWGIKQTSTLRLGKSFSVNSYLRLYRINTRGNELAGSYGIEDKNSFGLESGLSAIVSFKHGFSASFDFQYNSPKFEMQKKKFSDALYFVSINKEFNKRFKTGVKFALPFSSSFIYNGSSLQSESFTSYYEGTIKIPGPVVMLNLKYSFNTGVKTGNIKSRRTDNIDLPDKGF
ncbi:MAG: TonB-dependent receptor [Bacteroidales bacterium]|nr:TonB-dependent receptor [Bacteroidales bacterium]